MYVRYLDQRDLPPVETLGPLVASSLRLIGTLQPGGTICGMYMSPSGMLAMFVCHLTLETHELLHPGPLTC